MQLTYFKVNVQDREAVPIGESDLEKITQQDREENIYVINVDGKIIDDAHKELSRILAYIKESDEGYQRLKLYVDIERCPMIDESGLGVLVNGLYIDPSDEDGENPCRIRLANVNKSNQRKFEITKLTDTDVFGKPYEADTQKSLAENAIEAFKDY